MSLGFLRYTHLLIQACLNLPAVALGDAMIIIIVNDADECCPLKRNIILSILSSLDN